MSDQVLSDPATQNFIRGRLERMRDVFRGIFSAETTERFVHAAAASPFRRPSDPFRAAVYVNRFAGERLQALAQM